mmetsp:Transcript_18613/g.47163  ORF Transcript_18613/g.47163 Transcript_18613/m.47163 type:complete len:205 (+) Transcript_18613:380-994(+)
MRLPHSCVGHSDCVLACSVVPACCWNSDATGTTNTTTMHAWRMLHSGRPGWSVLLRRRLLLVPHTFKLMCPVHCSSGLCVYDCGCWCCTCWPGAIGKAHAPPAAPGWKLVSTAVGTLRACDCGLFVSGPPEGLERLMTARDAGCQVVVWSGCIRAYALSTGCEWATVVRAWWVVRCTVVWCGGSGECSMYVIHGSHGQDHAYAH